MIVKCKKCNAPFEPAKQESDTFCPNCRPALNELSVNRDRETHLSAPAIAYMKKKEAAKTELRLIVSAVMLLVVALGFNAMLTLNSLEKLYLESIVSQYRLIGKDLERNIEKSLQYGKNIEKFIGMDKLLKETKENIIGKIPVLTADEAQKTDAPGFDVTVSIFRPDVGIIYSTDKKWTGNYISEEIIINGSNGKISNCIKHNNEYLVTLSVEDGKNNTAANIVIAFGEERVQILLNALLSKIIMVIITILAVGMIILLFFIRLLTSGVKNWGHFPKLKIFVLMFLVIVFSQIVFSGISTYGFKNYYMQINIEKTKMLTLLLREDIEFFLSKGIRLDRLSKMEITMGETIASAPEIQDITIYDKNREPLYMASKQGVVNFRKVSDKRKNEILGSRPVSGHNIKEDICIRGRVRGYISANTLDNPYISTNISQNVIAQKIREVMLDSGTVIVISVLFFLELLILTFQYIEKQYKESVSVRINYTSIRPVAFLFFFGIDIAVSFLPLHMEKLYEPIFGLSKDIVMGLPISMQMLFTAISILVAGGWCDRRGWHEPFLTGIFISGVGFLGSWQASNAIHFILSYGMIGFGYGLSLMSSQGFVIAHTITQNRARGLAQLYAGIWAGSICGSTAGAMLAGRIGYEPVFFIGAAILFFVIIYTYLSMKSAMKKPPAPQIKTRTSPKLIFRFIFNRRIYSLILFSSLPFAIVLVGFLYYFSPIYLNGIGVSEANIGRIIMIYGICMVYVSPFITRLVGGSKNTKAYIAVGGVIGSLTFLCFDYFSGVSGILAAALGVLMLGLSASFAASRNAYALDLEISREIGEGKAMGIFYSMGRIGQIIGPILFAWLLYSAIGLDHGIVILGTSYLILTILFVILG